MNAKALLEVLESVEFISIEIVIAGQPEKLDRFCPNCFCTEPNHGLDCKLKDNLEALRRELHPVDLMRGEDPPGHLKMNGGF